MTKGASELSSARPIIPMLLQMPLGGAGHMPGAATGAVRPAGEFGQAGGRRVNEVRPALCCATPAAEVIGE